MQPPIVESFLAAPPGVPEIVGIHYDLWTLRISVEHSDIRGPRYVEFDGVTGFRVLDEVDLLDFWQASARVDGWIWRVKSGGWFDLEATRPGFVQRGAQEFLILGINECVSVLSAEEPVIREPAL